MRWRRSARHATDTMKRLFTPAGGRRRLVLGAFRGVASSPSHGPARNSSRVSGTPLVGGVSATDETPPTRGVPETRERSEEHTSELQSRGHLVCRLLLEKKKLLKYHNVLNDDWKLG